MATHRATHRVSLYPLALTRGRGHLLTTLLDLWRSRRALSKLDARALDDIGVSHRDAADEAGRPVWDVPANWRL